MFDATFDPQVWAGVPFHFWSVAFFVFGGIVGSFLNVCIYRLPLGQSIVSPPSHCPHCRYSIPWYLNIPLATWLLLRAKCRNCGAPISPRYFLVELLTALMFFVCWAAFGRQSPGLVLVYCLLLAGMIVATFIDFEHFIIPDEITYGGMVAGLICAPLVPAMFHETMFWAGKAAWMDRLAQSLIGLVVGGGVVYAILRLGKILFGKIHLDLDHDSRVVFTETALIVPPRRIPLEQLFQRRSGCFAFHAGKVELAGQCYREVLVGIFREKVHIGGEVFERAAVPHLEAMMDRLASPQESARLAGVDLTPLHRLFDWARSLLDLMTGARKTQILPGARLVVGSTEAWLCPEPILFEEIFYRETDTILCEAARAATQFGNWRDVTIRMSPNRLEIGEASFHPEALSCMEVVTSKMTLPREAMGLGDVKFMAAIGAFLGWQAVLFSLMVSSMIGAVVGITLIIFGRREWSSRLPYGPYIAMAAALWIFFGPRIVEMVFGPGIPP